MGWEGSDRKSRLPKDWPKLRAIVLRNAGYRCELVTNGVRCESRANQVDHIIRGDDHSLTNLQALCADHHNAKSSREGVEARMKLPKRARPAETHPGFL